MSVTDSAFDRIVAELDLSEVVGLPFKDQAAALAQLIQLIKDITELKSELEGLLFENMEADKVTVPGIGTLVRSTGGAYESWDKPALLRDLSEMVAAEVVDPETGALPSVEEVALTAMRALESVSSLSQPKFKGFKSTALRAMGLKASKYAEYVPGTVQKVVIL